MKARQFILALRDHYVDRAEHSSADQASPCIEYLDFPRLRHILEVFDEDASGYITVGEVNKFTGARPRDWSLPEWITFWAVGWQVAMV